jgi:hypothetical protein
MKITQRNIIQKFKKTKNKINNERRNNIVSDYTHFR